MSKSTKIIILVVVLIAAAAAVYYFLLRRKPITVINATPQYTPQSVMQPASGARMVSDLSNGLDADLYRPYAGGSYTPSPQISGGQAAQNLSTNTGARPVLPVYTEPINPTPVYNAPLVASNPVNVSKTDTLTQSQSQ